MKIIYNNPTGFKQRLKSFIENYFPFFYESYLWKVSKANDKYFSTVINADLKFIENLDHLPIFMQIEIETINRCNSDCSFCPINIHDDDRSFGLMTEELFFSIIDQLAILKYKGEISFHSNNEPLMDKRIIKFIKYAKKQCPEAYLLMYTNGILLTIDKFKELTQYLDHLRIDNYNDDYELNPAVAEILKYVNDSGQPFENVQIDVLKKIFKRNTRGGQASNRKNLISLKAPCLFPYTQFVVRPDGKISLCCIDTKGVYTLGDLNKETILDVWYGKKFQGIRKRLSVTRSKITLCEHCDSYAALPKAIIPHVEKSSFDRNKFELIPK